MGLKARKAESERKLAVKEDWTPCDYKSEDAYFRAIIDVVYMDDKVCYIEDHKSGQMYDSHAIQLSDYVAVVSANYPADEYRTRLIYIDQGVVTKPKVTVADRVKPIRLMLDGRIKNAETDTIFPTKAGQQCKWCDYSARYGGPCSF
jgi:hypothetical protein